MRNNTVVNTGHLQSGPKVLDHWGIITSDRTGTESTIERYIETGGEKGELHLDTRIWGNDFISESTKNQCQYCKRMNGAKKREAVQWLLAVIVDHQYYALKVFFEHENDLFDDKLIGIELDLVTFCNDLWEINIYTLMSSHVWRGCLKWVTANVTFAEVLM